MRIDCRTLWRNLASAAAIFCAGATFAGHATAQALSDEWKFRAIIYGYFPDIGGKTSFPAGSGSTIDVNADTILKNLKFVFMGTLEAQKGRWGAFTDIIYMDVGGDKSQSTDLNVGHVQLPAGVTADLSLDLKGTIWTLAGSYRLLGTPEGAFDVFAGARLLDLKETLNYSLTANVGSITGPGREGRSEAKVSNWDGIVGAKGNFAFGANREWFVPYYVDVGTGDSDLTWQGIVGIGYSFSWGQILAAWRYLDYDFKSGHKIEDVNFNGPAVGVAFRF